MSFLKFKQQDYETRICEICGQKFVADYGYSLALCWLVTGHAYIGAFMCQETPGNQHWGCCPEHALESALACAKDHMIPQLSEKYAECEKQQNPRISPEHAGLFDESNPRFYLLDGGAS